MYMWLHVYSSAKNFNESKRLLNLEPLKMKDEWNLYSKEVESIITHLVPKDERSLSVAGIINILYFDNLLINIPLSGWFLS